MATLLVHVICTTLLVGAGYYTGTHDPNFSTVLVFIGLVVTGNLLMITGTEADP